MNIFKSNYRLNATIHSSTTYTLPRPYRARVYVVCKVAVVSGYGGWASTLMTAFM